MDYPERETITVQQYYSQSDSVAVEGVTAEWVGGGALRLPEGGTHPIVLSCGEDTVGRSIDATALAPIAYEFDIWLKPPGGPAYKWRAGSVVVQPSVSQPEV